MAGPGALRRTLVAGAAALPPGSFAFSMASGIVSIGFEPVSEPVSVAAAAAGLVGFVGLLALSVVRALRFPDRLLADLASPERTFGFFTLVAAADVLAGRMEIGGWRVMAIVLGALGVVSWVVLTYAVPAALITAPRRAGFEGVDGGWLLWPVATESVAAIAALLGHDIPAAAGSLAAVAVCAWAVGVVLYLVVIVLVIARLLLQPLEREELTPAYWITMGATAITVLAGAGILGIGGPIPIVAASRPLVRGISLLLWAFGSWWIPLLLVLGAWRHRWGTRLGYELGLWSAVFPLGMYGTASRAFGDITGIGFIAAIGRTELWVALAAWLLLLVVMGRTALGVRGGTPVVG